MVTVIIGLASVPILGQFTQLAGSTLIDEDIQTASQLAQSRAENILALRRDQGYAAVAEGTFNEVLTGNFTAFSQTVEIAEPSSIGGCIPGVSCKSVTVTVSRGLEERAEISYVIMDY